MKITDTVLQEDLDYIAYSNLPFDKLKNSTILITGATGLIGVSLTRAILNINRVNKTNIKVYALVRNRSKAEDIYSEWISCPELKLVCADILQKIQIEEHIDFIIHCASITTSKLMIDNPVETILTSVEGTRNILDFAVQKKCSSVIYISSMEIYGSFQDGNYNVTEDKIGYINPLNLRSNYPESKRLCENMCVAYLSEFGVPVKIARLAQTFGAGILSGENRIFAQFARSVIKNKDIILHSQGLSEGNYCYTRDTVMALLLLLIKGINGEAYNISNPSSHMTIADMANMVSERIANKKIKVIFDIPKENIYGYAADTKMKLNSDKMQALGWKPEVSLEESYRRLIKSMIECSEE